MKNGRKRYEWNTFHHQGRDVEVVKDQRVDA